MPTIFTIDDYYWGAAMIFDFSIIIGWWCWCAASLPISLHVNDDDGCVAPSRAATPLPNHERYWRYFSLFMSDFFSRRACRRAPWFDATPCCCFFIIDSATPIDTPIYAMPMMARAPLQTNEISPRRTCIHDTHSTASAAMPCHYARALRLYHYVTTRTPLMPPRQMFHAIIYQRARAARAPFSRRQSFIRHNAPPRITKEIDDWCHYRFSSRARALRMSRKICWFTPPPYALFDYWLIFDHADDTLCAATLTHYALRHAHYAIRWCCRWI